MDAQKNVRFAKKDVPLFLERGNQPAKFHAPSLMPKVKNVIKLLTTKYENNPNNTRADLLHYPFYRSLHTSEKMVQTLFRCAI